MLTLFHVMDLLLRRNSGTKKKTLLLLLLYKTFQGLPRDGVPRMQKSVFPPLTIRSSQRFPIHFFTCWQDFCPFLKPEVGQNIAVHDSPAAKTSASLIFAFPFHSSSFFSVLSKQKMTFGMNWLHFPQPFANKKWRVAWTDFIFPSPLQTESDV